MDKIDAEIKMLNDLKTVQPKNAAKIDARIENLNAIKTEKQAENARYDDIVNNLDIFGRPEITIGTIMPDYEPSIASIDNSGDDEASKLSNKLPLHRDLITAIDAKIAALETEWNNNPGEGPAIQEEIKKLRELKEAKESEIAESEERIQELGGVASTRSVTNLTPDDFESDEGKEVMTDHQGTVDEIAAIDETLADLNAQKSEATSDKDIAKIDKAIEKEQIKKTKLENEILTDLGAVNQDEINTKLSDGQADNEIANTNNLGDPDIQTANDLINQANNKLDQAADKRNEAEGTKDPVEANKLLNEAFALETEAKDMIDKADRIYRSAIVIDNYDRTNNPDVITRVPSNNTSSPFSLNNLFASATVILIPLAI
jgi:hypothetical protein